jgi:hypothetical protein
VCVKKNVVFIQANDKQMLGAKLAEFAIRRASKRNDEFDIVIMRVEDFPHLFNREGQSYTKNGIEVPWDKSDLQSFTLTRFLPPQLMNFSGRALVIDPDVFATSNTEVMDLFDMDMEEFSLRCVITENENGRTFHSSNMLLDCNKLTDWNWDILIDNIFYKKVDYREQMSLKRQDPSIIGPLEEIWNHYDTLTSETKFIHFTKRLTQPWKTGLEVDFYYEPGRPKFGFIPRSLVDGIKRILKRPGFETHYLENPNSDQVSFFLDLVRDAVSSGAINKLDLESEIEKKHVRQDLLNVI